MSKTFFVTGTDTEVGKTAVSCAILEAAAAAGLNTAAVKPVAAGCDDQGQNEDALALMASMTAQLPYAQVNPVALAPAIAPHIAVAQVGRTMKASQLAGFCRGVMTGPHDLVLIEGAGGWRVPLSPRETLADLARELQVGVILVVGMRLGCINHALLTAEAVLGDGLPLAGWVANQPGERMTCHEENLDTLMHLLPAPFLGEVAHISPWSPVEAGQSLDIREIMQ
ncbi:dethiobiotin synthase [Halioglobus japonicus]|uniref:ATP-dependent dethiobiotin synthetase BioD n=1 Tax=Halioglobus japonicus TaxID=930805 RepID=A0AAP8SMK4_9GAMM|nr:dethiobiotin synthase [Halioglobus japonicus]AQA17213.1 dethiobiotin synthase [Halioglobus japonicus]PLW85128.1 dethiobiotin synthase [Halioglobus japonicus]GHD19589.1 ATP-dependent dethiobiotin synthetase BioD [Halioglobus japonicus]